MQIWTKRLLVKDPPDSWGDPLIVYEQHVDPEAGTVASYVTQSDSTEPVWCDMEHRLGILTSVGISDADFAPVAARHRAWYQRIKERRPNAPLMAYGVPNLRHGGAADALPGSAAAQHALRILDAIPEIGGLAPSLYLPRSETITEHRLQDAVELRRARVALARAAADACGRPMLVGAWCWNRMILDGGVPSRMMDGWAWLTTQIMPAIQGGADHLLVWDSETILVIGPAFGADTKTGAARSALDADIAQPLAIPIDWSADRDWVQEIVRRRARHMLLLADLVSVAVRNGAMSG